MLVKMAMRSTDKLEPQWIIKTQNWATSILSAGKNPQFSHRDWWNRRKPAKNK